MPQFCMWKNFQSGLALKFLRPKANCGTKDWQGEMNQGGEGRRVGRREAGEWRTDLMSNGKAKEALRCMNKLERSDRL